MTIRNQSARLDGLRKEAKRWLRALRAGEQEARVRLATWLPDVSTQPGLRQVQQALAREQGFESWGALKENAELEQLSAQPAENLLSELLRCACLSYARDDFPSKWRRADRILARHPELTTAHFLAAVVAGETSHVRRALAVDPTLANAPGGPQSWPPLLFLCYGRVAHQSAPSSAVEIAGLLLDAGADPNAGFWFGGDGLWFSALAGVMGQGELGQPEHPHADLLARLLLERGADPNQSQGLYNTHLVGDDTRWLELLSSFGLTATDRINWQPGAALSIYDYLLAQAAAKGQPARLQWLLQHGADPNARSLYTSKTAHQMALIGGHPELADLLLQSGARAEALAPKDAFAAAARRGDRTAAVALLEGHPEYLADVEPLLQAALAGDAACVRLLLELGMNPNGEGIHGNRALNNGCNHLAVVEALWEHGADPGARCFGGTPAGWALHAGNPGMARLHAERSRSLLDAVMTGHLSLIRELLNDDPTRVAERSPQGDTPLHELPEDPAIAEPIVHLLLAHGADRAATNVAGETPVRALERRGRDIVADLLDAS